MAGGVERFNVNASLSSNWEFLQTRFAGTGHPDITRHEWAAQHHRDTYASLLGHADLLAYAAAAENVAVGRMRHTLLERMLEDRENTIWLRIARGLDPIPTKQGDCGCGVLSNPATPDSVPVADAVSTD